MPGWRHRQGNLVKKASRSKPANCSSPSSNPALPAMGAGLTQKEESQWDSLFMGRAASDLSLLPNSWMGLLLILKPVQQILL